MTWSMRVAWVEEQIMSPVPPFSVDSTTPTEYIHPCRWKIQ